MRSLGRKPLSIAVVSGKGGTGKTSFSASLALSRPSVVAVDADVEEPNLALLLGNPVMATMNVTLPVPAVDAEKCTRCGTCSRTCRFGAVFSFGKGAPVFNDLCHGCGACVLACPERALYEVDRPVGFVGRGVSNEIVLVEGRLLVGMPNPVPVIERTVELGLSEGRDAVIDSPPGAACPMVAAVREADAAILVTEPTPFGMADAEAAAQVLRDMGKPAALVVNRSGILETEPLFEGVLGTLPELARLAFSRSVAEGSARGIPPTELDPSWREAAKVAWQWASEVAR
ncbi:MAG: 4Fe-4S binding protein [Synergistaceae bacterium]|nr:4Fe-4S binding protein [Synergistaceae bacterium]